MSLDGATLGRRVQWAAILQPRYHDVRMWLSGTLLFMLNT